RTGAMPMRPFRRQAVALTIAVTLAAAWGCGEGAPSVTTDTTEANVRGTVKIKGKPANGGEGFFNASNYRRRGEALRTGPDGEERKGRHLLDPDVRRREFGASPIVGAWLGTGR